MPLDADFPTGKECKYHCSPTCHPANIGPERVYGCTHKTWPQNIVGDFVPIVFCDGNPRKCEIPKKMLKNLITGRYRKIYNAEEKIEKYKQEIAEMESLLKGME